MDRRLLDYYESELGYLKRAGEELVHGRQKIAHRLGVGGGAIRDPHVERLMQGAAYLAARIQLKLDAEFPRFTQHLLETVYPNFLAPTPSMGVVQLDVDLNDPELMRGAQVPRHSLLVHTVDLPTEGGGKADSANVFYRTAQSVTLWPLQVDSVVHLPGNSPEVPLAQVPIASGVAACLRLRLHTTAGCTFNQLGAARAVGATLDTLPFYLKTESNAASRLMELLIAGSRGVILSGGTGTRPLYLPPDNLYATGFSDDEAMLPASARVFQGYRLMQEYLAFPERFQFLALRGLAPYVAGLEGSTLDIFFLLGRDDVGLLRGLGRQNFLLNCAAAVNLFVKNPINLHFNRARARFSAASDLTNPMDFEVHTIESITAFDESANAMQTFHPLYADHDAHGGSRAAFFTVERQPRVLSATQEGLSSRRAYLGSDTFVAIVDQAAAPYSGRIRGLLAEALCTNRDLPLMISTGTRFEINQPRVKRAFMISGPSKPYLPYWQAGSEWRFISLLGVNYLSLQDSNETEGAAALRKMLELFAPMVESTAGGEFESTARAVVNSVQSLKVTPVVRKLPQGDLQFQRWQTPRATLRDGHIAFGRGVQVHVQIDDGAFPGRSGFIFGGVLSHIFSRHVTVNSFAETVLSSLARGEIHRWAPQWGGMATC